MIEEKIFTHLTLNEFESLALEVFTYQYEKLSLYRHFCEFRKKTPRTVKNIYEIPFLPIQFFRTHTINTNNKYELLFESSGTTATQTSKHYIFSAQWYEKACTLSFQHFYGSPGEYLWIALMPDTTQRQNSSLVYMANQFVKLSKFKESGFYLNRMDKAFDVLHKSIEQNIPTICLGLTYALLDFAEQYSLPANNIIFMETGGMKGKRRELPRKEVHRILSSAFAVSHIHSEYGMTELLSQAYSQGNGYFNTPPWMKIIIRDETNPYHINLLEKRGGINIIDLANLYSCSFIETEDMGILHNDNTVEILGRLNQTIVRGCNTMME